MEMIWNVRLICMYKELCGIVYRCSELGRTHTDIRVCVCVCVFTCFCISCGECTVLQFV